MNVTQKMVDAAFPILHGDQEFRHDPGLRAVLEGPVREALEAALSTASTVNVRPDWVMDLDTTVTALEEAASDSNVHDRMITQLRSLVDEVVG